MNLLGHLLMMICGLCIWIFLLFVCPVWGIGLLGRNSIVGGLIVLGLFWFGLLCLVRLIKTEFMYKEKSNLDEKNKGWS